MSEKADTGKPDVEQLSKELFELAQRSQNMYSELLKSSSGMGTTSMDPLNVSKAMTDATQKLWMDPGRLMQANINLWQQHMQLWQQASGKLAGNSTQDPVASPDSGDRSFKHSDWEENPLFDFIKQSYLITARWLVDTMSGVEGIDEPTARKVEFYTRQFIDAMSP